MDRNHRGHRPPLHPRPHHLPQSDGDRGAHRRPVADQAARLCRRRRALYRLSRRRAMSRALAAIREYAVDRLRINYQSMVTPNTVYDYHLADGRLETLKVREIPSGYDASQYVTERLMAPSRDGAHGAGVGGLSPRLRQGRQGPPARLRLWRLWPRDSAGLLGQPAVAARSRLCLRDRAYPRRRRSRLPLVSRRQARQAHQHLQRFRRRDALSDRAGLRIGRAASPRPAARRAAN